MRVPPTLILALGLLLAAPAPAGEEGGPPVVEPGGPPPDEGEGDGGEADGPGVRPAAEAPPPLEAVRLTDPDGLFHLHDPPDAPPLRSRPLLVVLHAERVPAAEAAAAFAPEAKRRGWILAAPESRALQWRNPDGDIVLATVEAVAARTAVDPDRVFLLGIRSGALMATRWGLLHPGRWGGIVAHAGVQLPDLPKKPGPLPVLLSVGAKDEEWRAEVMAAADTLLKAGFNALHLPLPGLDHEGMTGEVRVTLLDFLENAHAVPDRRLARAERARREKRWADAWAEAQAVLASRAARGHRLAAEKEARYAERGAAGLVRKAATEFRKDPAAGRRALEEIEAAFPGSEAAARAREALEGGE